MQRFEHRVKKTDKLKKTIKKWESDGWEVISVMHSTHWWKSYKIVFKREYEELVP